MCNLSDLIEEGGIAKGIEQGRRMEMIDSRVEILSRWIKLASRVESVKEFAEAM